MIKMVELLKDYEKNTVDRRVEKRILYSQCMSPWTQQDMVR